MDFIEPAALATDVTLRHEQQSWRSPFFGKLRLQLG
jgi:hypothetical protein